MLDAAKAASTGPLDLPTTGASLCSLSLYKIFGYPTGLGALLIRSDLLPLLHAGGFCASAYFGGGAVSTVLACSPHHKLKSNFASAVSHGTPHYLGVCAVREGLRLVGRLGGARAIGEHTRALANELRRRLGELEHRGGRKVVEIYGKWGEGGRGTGEWRGGVTEEREGGCGVGSGHGCEEIGGKEGQPSHHPTSPSDLAPGPTIAFNLLRSDGGYVGYSEVAKLAALFSPPIQLRVGCCCNPGGCQRELGLSEQQIRAASKVGKE